MIKIILLNKIKNLLLKKSKYSDFKFGLSREVSHKEAIEFIKDMEANKSKLDSITYTIKGNIKTRKYLGWTTE